MIRCHSRLSRHLKKGLVFFPEFFTVKTWVSQVAGSRNNPSFFSLTFLIAGNAPFFVYFPVIKNCWLENGLSGWNKMCFLLKMGIFHCYVSLPEGIFCENLKVACHFSSNMFIMAGWITMPAFPIANVPMGPFEAFLLMGKNKQTWRRSTSPNGAAGKLLGVFSGKSWK